MKSSTGDGGLANTATLEPEASAVDPYGNVYSTDLGKIREILAPASGQAAGEIITVAGTGTAGYSGDGGSATSAQINVPSGVAFDPLAICTSRMRPTIGFAS